MADADAVGSACDVGVARVDCSECAGTMAMAEVFFELSSVWVDLS